MPQDNAAAINDLAINGSRNLEYNQEIIMQWNMAVSLLCFKIVKFKGVRTNTEEQFTERRETALKKTKPVINE